MQQPSSRNPCNTCNRNLPACNSKKAGKPCAAMIFNFVANVASVASVLSILAVGLGQGPRSASTTSSSNNFLSKVDVCNSHPICATLIFSVQHVQHLQQKREALCRWASRAFFCCMALKFCCTCCTDWQKQSRSSVRNCPERVIGAVVTTR